MNRNKHKKETETFLTFRSFETISGIVSVLKIIWKGLEPADLFGDPQKTLPVFTCV